MSDVLVNDIVNNLIKLKTIMYELIKLKTIMYELIKLKTIMYELDKEKMNKNIKDIDEIVNAISEFSNVSIEELERLLNTKKVKEKPKRNNKKPSFEDNIKLLEKRKFKDLKGVKLNYEVFKGKTDVIKYLFENEKEIMLKSTTVVDLKMLYFILIGRDEEIRGKKESIYEDIRGNIRARKRGEAFKNY